VYLQKVAQCPILTVDQVLKGQWGGAKEVQVQYGQPGDFTSMARQFKVMEDFKVSTHQIIYTYVRTAGIYICLLQLYDHQQISVSCSTVVLCIRDREGLHLLILTKTKFTIPLWQVYKFKTSDCVPQ